MTEIQLALRLALTVAGLEAGGNESWIQVAKPMSSSCQILMLCDDCQTEWRSHTFVLYFFMRYLSAPPCGTTMVLNLRGRKSQNLARWSKPCKVNGTWRRQRAIQWFAAHVQTSGHHQLHPSGLPWSSLQRLLCLTLKTRVSPLAAVGEKPTTGVAWENNRKQKRSKFRFKFGSNEWRRLLLAAQS